MSNEFSNGIEKWTGGNVANVSSAICVPDNELAVDGNMDSDEQSQPSIKETVDMLEKMAKGVISSGFVDQSEADEVLGSISELKTMCEEAGIYGDMSMSEFQKYMKEEEETEGIIATL